jgi:hypothetical protein
MEFGTLNSEPNPEPGTVDPGTFTAGPRRRRPPSGVNLGLAQVLRYTFEVLLGVYRSHAP